MKTSNKTFKIFYSKDLSFSSSFVGLLWVCVCRTTCSEYCVTGFLKSQKNIEKRKNIGQASLSFFNFLFSMFQSVLQCNQEENAMHVRLCLVVVKYFPERKIFSSVWLHYENCCRKYFHVFGFILKMLFSYKIFTFYRLFS